MYSQDKVSQHNHCFQWELWDECNSHCKMCYLKHDNKFTADNLKIASCNKLLDVLKDEDWLSSKYNAIGLIGGEFFQGQLNNPEVKSAFYDVIYRLNDLYTRKVVKSIWISASLLIGKQTDLYETLSKFSDLNNVWVMTSYDTAGRFQSPKMLSTWQYHMKHLSEAFPELKKNTTIIATGPFIQAYLDKKFNLEEFKKEYNTTVFFKLPSLFIDCGDSKEEFQKAKLECNKVIPTFFPTRAKLFEFLVQFKLRESIDSFSRLFNIMYRSDDLYRAMNSGQIIHHNRDKHKIAEEDGHPLNDCGHILDMYAPCCDSLQCGLCAKAFVDDSF